MVLLPGLLLAALTSASAPAATPGCGQVDLQSVKPMHFGTLAVGPSKRGWIVLDPGGGYALSNDMAVVGRLLPPSPGIVRLKAPAGSSVTLGNVRGTTEAGRADLTDITLGTSSRPLEQAGDRWLVRMPESAQAVAEIDISVGGRLNLHGVGAARPVSHTVLVDCVGSGS